MTTKELAQFCGKDERTVRRWIVKASDKMSSADHGNMKNANIEDTLFLYDKENICIICGVDVRTFEKFAPNLTAERDFIKKGSSHKAFYTENVLKQFQAWLMHNQATRGNGSEITKQAVQEAVEKTEKLMTTKELAEALGVDVKTIQRASTKLFDINVVKSVSNGGRPTQAFTEAQATAIKVELQNHTKVAQNGFTTLTISNDLDMMLMQQKLSEYQSKRIAELTRENEQLEAENKQLNHALEYDKVKEWHRWSDVKKQFGYKGNFETLANEYNLVQGEDFERKIMGMDKYATIMICPETVEMLFAEMK